METKKIKSLLVFLLALAGNQHLDARKTFNAPVSSMGSDTERTTTFKTDWMPTNPSEFLPEEMQISQNLANLAMGKPLPNRKELLEQIDKALTCAREDMRFVSFLAQIEALAIIIKYGINPTDQAPYPSFYYRKEALEDELPCLATNTYNSLVAAISGVGINFPIRTNSTTLSIIKSDSLKARFETRYSSSNPPVLELFINKETTVIEGLELAIKNAEETCKPVYPFIDSILFGELKCDELKGKKAEEFERNSIKGRIDFLISRIDDLLKDVRKCQ